MVATNGCCQSDECNAWRLMVRVTHKQQRGERPTQTCPSAASATCVDGSHCLHLRAHLHPTCMVLSLPAPRSQTSQATSAQASITMRAWAHVRAPWRRCTRQPLNAHRSEHRVWKGLAPAWPPGRGGTPLTSARSGVCGKRPCRHHQDAMPPGLLSLQPCSHLSCAKVRQPHRAVGQRHIAGQQRCSRNSAKRALVHESSSLCGVVRVRRRACNTVVRALQR